MDRAFYSYLWDLADRPFSDTLAECQDLGINTLSVATSYHAGRFSRPRGTRSRTIFLDDGTVYFRAHRERYITLEEP